MIYQAALREQLDAVAIGPSIERDRQVELGGVHSNRSTGDRDPLCIACQLEFGGGRTKVFERQLAVAEDVDLTVWDAPMDPTRHLENLVGAQVRPCQHVLAALHDIGVAGIVNHHRIQATNVERRLARRRHREQEGTFDQTVKKRTNDTNRLAAVVKGSREVGPAIAELFCDLFDLGPGRDEYRHAAALSGHPLYEAIV